MNVYQFPQKLPEIRVPRIPEPTKRLPEIKYNGSRFVDNKHNESENNSPGDSIQDSPKRTRSHSSPRASLTDPPSPKLAKERFTSSSKDNTTKTKQKREPTSLDSTPLSSPILSRITLDPPRKRSSSSSQVPPSTSPTTLNPSPLGSPSKILPPVDFPKRSASQPLLPLASPPIAQLPSLPHHTSVASILLDQAENSMKTAHALPAFSNRKPLAPRSPSRSLGDLYDHPSTFGSHDTQDRAQEPTLSLARDTTHAVHRARSTGEAHHKLEKINSEEELNTTTTANSEAQPTTIHESDTNTNTNEANNNRGPPSPATPTTSTSQTHRSTQENAEDVLSTTTPGNEPHAAELDETRSDRTRAATLDREAPPEKKSPFQVCLADLSVRVFVCTWNMQGKPPPISECETTIQRALLSPPKQKWEDKVASTLGSEYIMLPSSTLGAVHLAVFVHTTLLPLISEVRTGSIPTGLGNVVANKGGVAVTFYIGTTSVAFVAAHFTAHHSKVEQRNADFHRINTMLSLSSPSQLQPPSMPVQNPQHPPPSQSSQSSLSSSQSIQPPNASRSSSTSQLSTPSQPSNASSQSQISSSSLEYSNSSESSSSSLSSSQPPELLLQQQTIRDIQQTTQQPTQQTPHESMQEDGQQQDPKKQAKEEQANPEAQDPVVSQTQTPTLAQTLMNTQTERERQTQPQTQAQTQQRMPPLSATLTERFDRVFWFGDLNYRINGNKRIVEQTIKQNLMEVLVANDQLTIEKKKGNIFQGFLEGPLNFVPTYKYDAGTDDFDTSAKARVPSWTDRILFKTSEHVTLDTYDSCAALRYTDHRPVFASFAVGFSPPNREGGLGPNGQPAGSKVCTIL